MRFGLYFLLLNTWHAVVLSNERPDKQVINDLNYDFCGQLGPIDDAYCYLNYGVDSTADTINNWFKHEGGNQDTLPTTRGKLRFGWEPRSGDFSEIDFRFRIRATLPALKDRVELFLSDEEDSGNQQALKSARRDELGNNDQTVLALQFKQEDKDKLSYRVGFGRGSQLYTRARYTDEIKYSKDASLYYYAESHWYSGDKLGVELNAEFGYVFDSRSAFEFNNNFRFRDKTDDWVWRHEVQYLHLAKNDTSYVFTAMIDGLSRPNYRKEQMLLSMRYKRKVLRDWLFIEVEPFILWLREENFRASPGVAIRAEVHFST